MYIVIKRFVDLSDNDHAYGVGDIFPRPGANVSEERIKELSGCGNRLGVPLIEVSVKRKRKK